MYAAKFRRGVRIENQDLRSESVTQLRIRFTIAIPSIDYGTSKAQYPIRKKTNNGKDPRSQRKTIHAPPPRGPRRDASASPPRAPENVKFHFRSALWISVAELRVGVSNSQWLL